MIQMSADRPISILLKMWKYSREKCGAALIEKAEFNCDFTLMTDQIALWPYFPAWDWIRYLRELHSKSQNWHSTELAGLFTGQLLLV